MSDLSNDTKKHTTKSRETIPLNTERIMPEFLKLAKSLNTDYSLKDIRGADGMRFASESLEEKFIVDYFADIYKKPECDCDRPSGLIEDFVGPEVHWLMTAG
jgi:hypothetical protein